MLIFEAIWGVFVPPSFSEGFSGRKSGENVLLEPGKPWFSLGRYAKSMLFVFFEIYAEEDPQDPPQGRQNGGQNRSGGA